MASLQVMVALENYQDMTSKKPEYNQTSLSLIGMHP